MGISVYLENQIHERIGRVYDDADESFMRACELAPVGSVMRSVIRHGDTMLNVYQLRIFEAELQGLPGGEITDAISGVMDAATAAIRRRGYLYFVGD